MTAIAYRDQILIQHVACLIFQHDNATTNAARLPSAILQQVFGCLVLNPTNFL